MRYKDAIKWERLRQYSSMQPVDFVLYEGYSKTECPLVKTVSKEDKDGDLIAAKDTVELMPEKTSIRLYVKQGTPKAEVLRLMKKILECIDESYDYSDDDTRKVIHIDNKMTRHR